MAKKSQDVSYSLKFPQNKYAELKVAAASNGMPLSAFIRNAAYAAVRQGNQQMQQQHTA
jgi:hypothetical protein